MQAYKREAEPPDLDNPQRLIDFFELMRELRDDRRDCRILAYHDRSDGGLLVALMEMAFAAHCGVCCELSEQDELLPALFGEAPGALVQIREDGIEKMYELMERYKDTLKVCEIAHILEKKNFEVRHKGQSWVWDLMHLKRWWSETGIRIQALRDDRQCAEEEMDTLCDAHNPGLRAEWDFALPDDLNYEPTNSFDAQSFAIKAEKPKVAILREQGVNGHKEMAAAFERAGFARLRYTHERFNQRRGRLEVFSRFGCLWGFLLRGCVGGRCGLGTFYIDARP